MPGDVRQASLCAFEPVTMERRGTRQRQGGEGGKARTGNNLAHRLDRPANRAAAGGFALAGLLLIQPAAGIAIMWNIFIPAAPALVTVAPGLWRNICPMSTFSLLPKQFGLSRRKKMPEAPGRVARARERHSAIRHRAAAPCAAQHRWAGNLRHAGHGRGAGPRARRRCSRGAAAGVPRSARSTRGEALRQLARHNARERALRHLRRYAPCPARTRRRR